LFVYFARPIDQAGSNSWLGSLAQTIEHKLAAAEVGAYRPAEAYLANPKYLDHALFIDESNNAAIYRADAFIAILPAGVPTLGTPVEINTALMLNKPTVIFTDITASVQLAAWRTAGAQIVDLSDDGVTIPGPNELLAMLRVEPDPERGSEPEHGALLVKYDPGALPLTRAHDTDAGFDLATLEDVTLRRGQRVLLRTGVRGSIPDGWFGRITGRSSALANWSINVHEGIIDAGYTGELMIGVTYAGVLDHLDVPRGTRLAQYILAPVWDGEIKEVDELPTTARGENGWGSSGN
jgi:dUTP pyrophosphatase